MQCKAIKRNFMNGGGSKGCQERERRRGGEGKRESTFYAESLDLMKELGLHLKVSR